MFVGTSPERPLLIFAAIAETDTVMARAAVRRRAMGINPLILRGLKQLLLF
jgi:hypothetical protein